MKRFAFFALFVLAAPSQRVSAAGIIRIANGDCAALTAAASGHGPSSILLARNGSYSTCSLNVAGNISIDGAGAQMQIAAGTTQIAVAGTGTLTVHNLNFVGVKQTSIAGAIKATLPQPNFIYIVPPLIQNGGYLSLDAVSISAGSFFSSVSGGGGILSSGGHTDMNNVSIVNNNFDLAGYELFDGDIAISQSTIANNSGAYAAFRSGPATMANSIVATATGATICTSGFGGNVVSGGGNITTDASCAFNGTGDHVVANAGLGDFGTHGGVVDTLALNNDSPAVGNGIAANCAATDARGVARGSVACDSGAYEFGGGQGKLGVSGMTGLYYNPAYNGHYVSVQRLGTNLALVIWNTFDQAGRPAWVYGVGTISGTTIQIPQVAENVGGILHPGGAVTGETPTLWGSMTLDLSNCRAAQLSYQSILPLFGSGSINLQRLVFIDDLGCSP